MSEQRLKGSRRLAFLAAFFYGLAFLLLALRNGSPAGYTLAAAVPLGILAGCFLLPSVFRMDGLTTSLVLFLCPMGLLLITLADPASAPLQGAMLGAGLLVMLLTGGLVRGARSSRVIWVLIPAFLIFLALPLFGAAGALPRNAISIASFSLRPSEAGLFAWVLVSAWFLSRRQSLLFLLFTVLTLGLLLLQEDLWAALLALSAAALMYWAYSGNWLFTLLGLACIGGGAWLYLSSSPLPEAFSRWFIPSGEAYAARLSALSAISEGGLWGVGLGLGDPAILSGVSGFSFAQIIYHMGMAVGGCFLVLFAFLLWRGTNVAMATRRSFHGLTAMGAVLLLGLRGFLSLGGTLGLIVATGLDFPFLSPDPSSLLSALALAGLIQGVHKVNQEARSMDARLVLLERSSG